MAMKAQMWSFDLALSLVIFFSAMLSLLFAWNYVGANIAEGRVIKDAQLKALTVSDSLLRTDRPAGSGP